MYLRHKIEEFSKTKSPVTLKEIKKRWGPRGFSLACKHAGISRSKGKRLIDEYDDTIAIKQVTQKACGLKKATLFK